jgi:hypothetical protein
MPRKKLNPEDKKDNIKKNKKNLINTMLKDTKDINNNEQHIILQLPLTQQRINNLINNDNINIYDNTLPKPYEPNSYFINKGENITNKNDKIIINEDELNEKVKRNGLCCYWCCHPIEQLIYGMPYNYDSINDTYLIYGSFCSLQCANAYNFSIHCGSDKVWEINSWIQILGKRYGFTNPIRPAPSRFLLKMFNGNLSIEEFRKTHLTNDKTYLLNIPPMISISTSIECINTSFLSKITETKEKEKRKYINNNTIDSKLNLIIS